MHKPVLLSACVRGLNIKPGGVYVDGTFGRGGHSQEILKHLGPQGKLLVFDKDPEAVLAAQKLQASDPRVIIAHASFAELKLKLEKLNFLGQIDGVLLDLGVSSPQLDQAARGFSFMQDGPLDMRMNCDESSQDLTAADLIEKIDEKNLAQLISEFGEEKFAKKIAHIIKLEQIKSPIKTTLRLAALIKNNIPFDRKSKKHPATRTFQALRIAVNHELEDLKVFLDQIESVLAPKGRLVIMSFHSLEDRIVKQFIDKSMMGCTVPRRLPIMEKDILKNQTFRWVKKKQLANTEEIAENSRSRSVVLRVAEKLG
jgi:16S rRNA (cytosine1402-N4)-methyltransferase